MFYVNNISTLAYLSMQIGIDSFVETILDPLNGAFTNAGRVRDLLEEIELADQVGLDVFGIGEHHRQELSLPHPPSYWLRLPLEPSRSA
jgi:hypothetical protein